MEGIHGSVPEDGHREPVPAVPLFHLQDADPAMTPVRKEISLPEEQIFLFCHLVVYQDLSLADGFLSLAPGEVECFGQKGIQTQGGKGQALFQPFLSSLFQILQSARADSHSGPPHPFQGLAEEGDHFRKADGRSLLLPDLKVSQNLPAHSQS